MSNSMNGIVVNVRGGNAVGKSSAMRRFIEMHKSVEIISVPIKGQSKPSDVTKLDGGSVYVLGRYDSTSPGCDRYSGKEQITNTILTLIIREDPKAIVFEGFIFSVTANATVELTKKLAKVGWRYQGLLFNRPFDSVIELLEKRNGGGDYDIANVLENMGRTIRSAELLNQKGVSVKSIDIDPSKYSIEDAAKIIWNEVYR